MILYLSKDRRVYSILYVKVLRIDNTDTQKTTFWMDLWIQVHMWLKGEAILESRRFVFFFLLQELERESLMKIAQFRNTWVLKRKCTCTCKSMKNNLSSKNDLFWLQFYMVIVCSLIFFIMRSIFISVTVCGGCVSSLSCVIIFVSSIKMTHLLIKKIHGRYFRD